MPWEQVGGADSSPDGAEFFWDSIDPKVPVKEYRLIDCRTCSQRLRVPSTYDGSISCPKCQVKFSTKDTESTEKSGWRFFHFIFVLTGLEGFAMLLFLVFF